VSDITKWLDEQFGPLIPSKREDEMRAKAHQMRHDLGGIEAHLAENEARKEKRQAAMYGINYAESNPTPRQPRTTKETP